MKKITLLLSQALIFTIFTFAQKITDKIVLNKGQKFSTTSTTTGTSSMQMMGQNMETLSESSSNGTIEVKDVTPTSYKLTTTVSKMKLKTNAMGQEVNFDSDKKEDLEGEMGQAVKSQLDPKDEEITFTGKSISNVTKSDNEDMKKVMEYLGGMGENGVADNFILVPSGKKTGDTWMDSSAANGIKIKNNYSLKQMSGTEATVGVNTISTINKTVQAQGADVMINMDLNSSATHTVDITTGLIKEKKVITEAKGNINAGGQEIPLTSKATTIVTIKSL